MKKENNETNLTLAKIRLLFDDYIQATTLKEKDVILLLLGEYVEVLDDERITFLYYQICQFLNDDKKRELYTEILQDLLYNYDKSNDIEDVEGI